MDKKNNTVPKGQQFKNAIQSEPQNDDMLQELMSVWQQHGERIELIARQHDLSQIRLVPRLLVFSSRRRSALSTLAMAIVCLAAIVGMVILHRHFISDIFDQLFFAFLGLLLVVAITQFLRQIFLLRPQPLSIQPPAFNMLHMSCTRAAVFASVVVMFLFLEVPVQNGRSMSQASLSHRSASITNVSFVLSHIQ